MTTEGAADQRQWRGAGIVIGGVMLVVGACGLVYEYTLGVLGNNLIGSSHEQIFVIIGLMLFAMGIGAGAQTWLKKDLLDRFVLVEVILAALGGVSVVVISAAYAYLASYQVVLYGWAALMGLLIGAEIPLILRVNQAYGKTLCPNIGTVLCVDYLGALVGALAFAYLLIPNLPLDRIVVTLAAVNLVVAAISLVYFWPLLRSKRTATGAVLATAALLAATAFGAGPVLTTLEQRVYRDPIVHATSSPYQRIVMTRRGADLRLYLNGQLQFSSIDEHRYHEFLVHPPFRAHAAAGGTPRKVLILGGGDGLAAREVLKYPGVESVLLVDLDPVVTALAATQPDLVALNHGAFADARMDRRSGTGVSPAGTEPLLLDSHLERRLLDGSSYEVAEVAVRNLDADAFIRQAEDHYDLVIIDFPDPSQLELCKLYSREFYLALRTRLAPGAMLAIQSTSPEHAPLVFRCIGQTLAASGFSTVPYQHNVPSFGQWGWHLAWADDRSTQSVLDSLGPSAGPMAVDTQALTPSLLAAACVFPKGVLEGEAVGVNTKMRPVILDYFRRSWSQR